jgi:hypothetical protein
VIHDVPGSSILHRHKARRVQILLGGYPKRAAPYGS